MKRLFNNVFNVTAIYFCILAIDLILIVLNDFQFLRLVTKPLLVLLLIAFYIYNDEQSKPIKLIFLIIALSCFLLANVMTLFKTEPVVLLAGSICFILGKVFYIFRFSNKQDFNLLKIFPILALYLLYMIVILNLTFDNLGESFIPVLLFLFVTLLTVQFALLRKNDVKKLSYKLVLFGVLLFLVADTSSVLGSFYMKFSYQEVFTMLVYATAQYLIIRGLINENKHI